MSSWVALRRRIDFRAGQDVLVLGPTGNAGRMAIQVARRLGADRVIAAGRDTARLAALTDLGATGIVPLDDLERLGEVAADVDVVLDYVWGAPTAGAMAAVVTHRRDPGAPLAWVEIGSVAGPTATIPSAALRAARLQIVGSGQGSVPTRVAAVALQYKLTASSGARVSTDGRDLGLGRGQGALAGRRGGVADPPPVPRSARCGPRAHGRPRSRSRSSRASRSRAHSSRSRHSPRWCPEFRRTASTGSRMRMHMNCHRRITATEFVSRCSAPG
jgi:zinc-binding dehydrogenase